MSTPTQTGTHGTGRSGRRKIGRLLSSSGRIALIGAIASLATVGFVLWIQAVMLRQQRIGEPLARLSMELEHYLERSFVQLDEWVAFENEAARKQREALWYDEIFPRFEKLDELSENPHARGSVEDIQALEAKLRRLAFLQWYVEDVVHTPANVPARVAYVWELEAIVDLVPQLLALPMEGEDTAQDAQRLMIAFQRTDRTLVELLEDGAPVLAETAGSQSQVAAEIAKEIIGKWEKRAATDRRAEALVAAARETMAYGSRAPIVAQLRTAEDWNVAEHVNRTKLDPLRQDVMEHARRITEFQLNYVKKQGRGLIVWSFVVLGLALLLGGLSIGSMYLSYRLEDRVQRALARAQSLGQYVIDTRVGGGGMGEVYRASHALLRRPAAVKVLRVDSTFDAQAQQRFRREVQATSQLTHPNTIAIYDYGKTPEGLFYYAMELLDGVTLDALVRATGPLPPGRVVHILRQVCGSIQEAHDKGLLHRDIKPSNVMLAELGGVFDRVKVLDFGLVTRVHETPVGSADAIVGTPAYLAPEAIRGSDNVSPRTDVYAIGAVAYFLLTGTSVFEETSVRAVLERHLHDLPEPPSSRLGGDIPEHLELLVLGCLAKSPDDRPGSAAALAAMLDEADVPNWTDRDAALWWDEYGEAIRALVRADEDEASAPSHIGRAKNLDVSRTGSPEESTTG